MTRYLLLFLSLLSFVCISYADQIYVASNTFNTDSNSGTTSTSQNPPPSPWSSTYKPSSPLPQSNPLPQIPHSQTLPQSPKLPQIPNASASNPPVATSPLNASQTPVAPNSPVTLPSSANNNLMYNDTFKAKWMETCTKGSGSNSVMLSQKFCECGWDKITAQIPVQSWLNQNPQNLAQMNVQLKVILQECQVAVQTGS